MKRILTFLILTVPFFISAQNIEVGLAFGASGYQGDLTPGTSRTSYSNLHASFGIFGRYNINKHFGYRGSFTYGKVSGTDADAEVQSRVNRNLSFESTILELALIGEYNIFGRHKRFTPYVFAGIALFHFNPKANFQGQLVELQPLGTEGQGMVGFQNKYSRTQVAIPMGAGLKFAITDRINLGVELGLRKLFTDYLDDVSGTYVNFNDLRAGNGDLAAQLGNRTGELLGTEPVIVPTGTQRGNADSKDWYFIPAVTLSYNLFNDKDSWANNRGGKELGCPF